MSLLVLERLGATGGCRLISSDLFDTVLLRDSSTQTQRLAEAAGIAARRLGLDVETLVRLRWAAHDASYRAVAIERPGGDASLSRVCAAMASALRLDTDAQQVLVDAEVEVDARRLRPNRPLLRVLNRLREPGRRVVAVSDTYYSAAHLKKLLVTVTGSVPFDEVYSSADLGRTKHAGTIFAIVGRNEGVRPSEVVHVGDDTVADVDQPTRAGWTSVHLARSRPALVYRRVGKLMHVPVAVRRTR